MTKKNKGARRIDSDKEKIYDFLKTAIKPSWAYEISNRLGIPQRRVSYILTQLKKEGKVQSEDDKESPTKIPRKLYWVKFNAIYTQVGAEK